MGDQEGVYGDPSGEETGPGQADVLGLCTSTL